jgi:hypothetical protein
MSNYATFDKDAEGLLSRLNFLKAIAEADLPIVTNNKKFRTTTFQRHLTLRLPVSISTEKSRRACTCGSSASSTG